MQCVYFAQLASLLQQQKQPSQALEIVDKLLVELKKLDDKQMLTETHLTEARIYHSLQNIPKGELLVLIHLPIWRRWIIRTSPQMSVWTNEFIPQLPALFSTYICKYSLGVC
jgi:hypothetical protein